MSHLPVVTAESAQLSRLFYPGNVLVPFAGAIKVKHVEAEGFHLLFTFGPLKEIGCLREPGSLHLDLMPRGLPACS